VEKIFDSKNFPARDALAAWTEVTSDALMPTSFKLIGTEAFHGRWSSMPLGAVEVSKMAHSPFLAQRTPKLIRASDPEILAIGLTGSGTHAIEQNRCHTPLHPGELLLFESSHPFEIYADGEDILLQFPRALLPLPDHRIEQLICRPFPSEQGIGRLLVSFIVQVTDDSINYTPHDAARLGTVALDLITATLAHLLERDEDVPSDSRKRVLYLSITSFIERYLGDPDLTVNQIAAAHHISVRSLHRLFQQHGTSVHAWIRGQRLEHSRRDLADPSRRHVPIAAIAARWGFPRHADFTRAFRFHYGITPSTYRHTALREEPGARN
jgi:AraC-like DNA-binding protein